VRREQQSSRIFRDFDAAQSRRIFLLRNRAAIDQEHRGSGRYSSLNSTLPWTADLNKNELTYLNTLAISMLASGFGDQAAPAYDMLTDQMSGHAAGPIGLASVALAQGNIDEACEILNQRSEQIAQDSQEARKMLLSAIVATNNFDHADALLATLNDSAANDDPLTPRVWRPRYDRLSQATNPQMNQSHHEPPAGGELPDVENLQLVESAAALDDVCRQLATQDWFALDTEFLREKTYRPQLALIQVADASGLVACIDPLAVEDLAPFTELLHNDRITKVLHAAGQDLEIFYWLTGKVPSNLFDTQIAAPLLGYQEQLGYANLIREMLKIELPKSHSRADWMRRPLPPKQLQYAADDVIYLARIYPLMVAKLTELGRLDWLSQEWLDLETD